jgi:rRNA-processing protein FCF1
MKKNAVLDTNIFLHYDIQSIDWLKELSATEVEIIVCSTVIEELDRKKEEAKKGLAERARRNLGLIESLDGVPNGVRNNVKLTALGTEPQVDWHSLHLDANLSDDRILASIIERNNDNDIFITDDTAPRIKAKKRNLKWAVLRSQRLEQPRSEEEKELQQLKAKVQSYENRTPKLSLMLKPEVQNETGSAIFLVKKSGELPESEVRRLINEKKRQIAIDDPAASTSRPAFDSMFNRPAYRQYWKYLSDYEEYLNQKNAFEQQRARTFEMNFVIGCEGNVPAKDVYCQIEFPEGVEIFKESDAPLPPEEPEHLLPNQIYPRDFRTTRQVVSLHDSFGIPESTMKVIIESNIVEVRLDDMQHNFDCPLDKLFVKLPMQHSFKNFSIKYLIYASNLPVPVTGSIPVIFKNADGWTPSN